MIGDQEDTQDRDLKIGAIVGVRAWWVYQNRNDPDDYLLRSGVVRYLYESPVNRNDDPPEGGIKRGGVDAQPDDKHGFYAYRTDSEVMMDELTKYMESMEGRFGGSLSNAPKAFGRVSLFGTVRVHEKGYRSQCLRVDKLWVAQGDEKVDWNGMVNVLESRYRCPVEVWPGEIPDEVLEPELAGVEEESE